MSREKAHLNSVFHISASAACSFSTALIVDFWQSLLDLNSSALHSTTRAGAVFRPLMFCIHFTSHVSRVLAAFFRDIHLSSHISCCCLDFCATTSATNQKHRIFHDFQQRRNSRLNVTSSEQGDCRKFDRVARLLWFHALILTRRCSTSCSVSLLSCHSITVKRRFLSTRSGERVRRYFFHWLCGSCFPNRDFLRREMFAASWSFLSMLSQNYRSAERWKNSECQKKV